MYIKIPLSLSTHTHTHTHTLELYSGSLVVMALCDQSKTWLDANSKSYHLLYYLYFHKMQNILMNINCLFRFFSTLLRYSIEWKGTVACN